MSEANPYQGYHAQLLEKLERLDCQLLEKLERLECENAALQAELKRQRALWQATHALGLAEREFAIKCIETALRKEAQP